jgi:hypothetical protein
LRSPEKTYPIIFCTSGVSIVWEFVLFCSYLQWRKLCVQAYTKIRRFSCNLSPLLQMATVYKFQIGAKSYTRTFQIGTWRKYLVHVWKTDSYLSKRPIDLEMWHALKLMKVGTYKSISVVYMTPSNQMENSDCLLESNNYLGIQKFGFIVNWNKNNYIYYIHL